MFILVLLGLLALKLFLEKCPWVEKFGWKSANLLVSAGYIIATVWRFFGGLASVMLRSVTSERLRMNQLRGLYYTTLYEPWLGSMFAVIVYFGITAKIVPIAMPEASVGKMCLWGILVSRRGLVSG
jgi:hypothetical protein